MENKGEIVIYPSKNGKMSLDVKLVNDTVWLTQKQIAQLFGTQRPAITKHLKNVFKSRELEEDSVCSILEHTAMDGKTYGTNYYNLDAIISVGYRVNSKRATQFRIWATNILKNHIINGISANFKRLKELEEKFDAHRYNYDEFKHLINKFLINSARRDVLNAVIDEVEGLKKDHKTVLEALKRLDIKKDS